jgi:hypothetical protein
MACPEGRVPFRRITLAQMARFGKFEDFFAKGVGAPMAARTKGGKPAAKKGAARKPRPRGRRVAAAPAIPPQLVGSQGEIHRHAICQVDGGPFVGCSAWFNTWDTDPTPGVFNLSQLWLVTQVGQKPYTIESGWQVYPGQWSTRLPVIFVFYNPDGYRERSGYFTNQSGEGFIQYSSDWPLGTALSDFSTVGGTQYGFQMQWELDAKGNWWLSLGSDASNLQVVGSFPASAYANTPLAQRASALQFGGEVCSASPSTATGPMGSGLNPTSPPSAGFGRVAFQKLLAVQTDVGGSMQQAQVQPRDTGDVPNYELAIGTSQSWGSYHFFGGASAP